MQVAVEPLRETAKAGGKEEQGERRSPLRRVAGSQGRRCGSLNEEKEEVS